MIALSRPFTKIFPSIFFRSFHSNLGPIAATRRHRYSNFISAIPDDVSWILPFFAILSKSIGSYQSLATEASPDEEVVPDEFLNEILSDIERSPKFSSEKLCTTYIDKLLKAGNPSAAARFMQSLHDKHIFLSPNAYNLLLVAASEANAIDFLSQIFKDLLVSNKPLSSTSYFNVAKVFTKTDDSVLLKFVREVSELTFPRNATILNRIIHAFAECRQIEKSLIIFDHMKSLKCKPDLITYNTVLGFLGRAGRLDEMLHEFSSMKVANIAPDIISYNTLLNSLQKVGRLDLCLVFFREMGENGLKPDLRTYRALIEGFGQSGNLEEALRLFSEMKQGQICPSIYIYRSLINYSKKMGKVELAMSLSEEMNACLPDLIGPKDFKQKNR
ncbi:hypothetical protein VitviT2T_017439 [Vitis vinifera]|uniref:Pentatricopeptide repeat-containing protein n=2 Tax=Vitis vinifera TaxID=29760 RepID=A0ABY9CU71_VITVI|eukprot:XP_002279448.2 PREDICTED: pentatricopeptide repeat-containing protein At1g11900 isoform X1 [Vitis vinifera]